MRAFILVLLLIHGGIHLLGFLKAFQLAEIKDLTLAIPKAWGMVWLLSFLLLSLTGLLYGLNHRYWWIAGLLAIFVSQLLIFYFWKDARFGTLANGVLLVVALVAYFNYSFQRSTEREVKQILARAELGNPQLVDEARITRLPAPVQNWLRKSGMIGKPEIATVFIHQKAFMKMKPDAEKWTEATARQVVTTSNPAFVWSVNMEMMPLVPVVGRDKFRDGKGEMLIKVLSLIPVVNSHHNEKLNAGTLQRYLGEIVWYPSAALNSYIKWEALDVHSARATMTYGGTTGSGVFQFDENGLLKRYTAMRYMDGDASGKAREWIIDVKENKELKGIVVPVKMTATWKLETGDWTWLELEITDISYNATLN